MEGLIGVPFGLLGVGLSVPAHQVFSNITLVWTRDSFASNGTMCLLDWSINEPPSIKEGSKRVWWKHVPEGIERPKSSMVG
jgi:hypothetical protein